MAIRITSKYEENPIKIEGARVATTQNIGFSNTQGQITPQSEVGVEIRTRPRSYRCPCYFQE